MSVEVSGARVTVRRAAAAPAPARRSARAAGRDGAPATARTRTAWCASPARWSARSTGARRPTSTPFVEVGQRVEAGRPLCLIEAMKLFNEIVAERGRHGADRSRSRTRAPAEFGQLLFLLEP